MKRIHLAPLAFASVLSACGGGSSAPSLTMSGPADHARYFPIATGDSHDLVALTAYGSCNGCHADTSVTPSVPSASFTIYTCTNCHDVVVGVVAGANVLHGDQPSLTTLHASVTDFTSKVNSLGLSAACLSCHPDGGGGAPSNHEQLFPRAAGTRHAGISCVACHGTGSRTDLNSLACYTCHVTNPRPPLPSAAVFNARHQAPLNHTSTGENRYTLLDMTSPPVCLRCHAPTGTTGKLVPITQAGHPKGESGNNTGDHVNVGCVDCHNTQRSVLGRYNTQDFSRRGCLICHSSNNP